MAGAGINPGTRVIYVPKNLDTLNVSKFYNTYSSKGAFDAPYAYEIPDFSVRHTYPNVVHCTPQAIFYRDSGNFNNVYVFYTNANQAAMVVRTFRSSDPISQVAANLLPLGNLNQVGLGFLAYESLVPYTLDDKTYIFYYSANGIAFNGLFYAAYNADFSASKFRKYAVDQPVTNPDWGNNQVHAIDYVSVVAGPDGPSMPYLFWNSLNEQNGQIYLNACQLQLNSSGPSVSIVKGSTRQNLTETYYAPSAVYIDDPTLGQYFAIFHNQQSKQLECYILGLKRTNKTPADGDYQVLYYASHLSGIPAIGHIWGATAPCGAYWTPGTSKVDVYLVESDGGVRMLRVDLSRFTGDWVQVTGTLKLPSSVRSGGANLGVSVVRVPAR